MGSICNHGDVRLVGGASQLNGRVEVCFNNQWGSVCSAWWTQNDANVACGQAGQASAGLKSFTRFAFLSFSCTRSYLVDLKYLWSEPWADSGHSAQLSRHRGETD